MINFAPNVFVLKYRHLVSFLLLFLFQPVYYLLLPFYKLKSHFTPLDKDMWYQKLPNNLKCLDSFSSDSLSYPQSVSPLFHKLLKSYLFLSLKLSLYCILWLTYHCHIWLIYYRVKDFCSLDFLWCLKNSLFIVVYDTVTLISYTNWHIFYTMGKFSRNWTKSTLCWLKKPITITIFDKSINITALKNTSRKKFLYPCHIKLICHQPPQDMFTDSVSIFQKLQNTNYLVHYIQ